MNTVPSLAGPDQDKETGREAGVIAEVSVLGHLNRHGRSSGDETGDTGGRQVCSGGYGIEDAARRLRSLRNHPDRAAGEIVDGERHRAILGVSNPIESA